MALRSLDSDPARAWENRCRDLGCRRMPAEDGALCECPACEARSEAMEMWDLYQRLRGLADRNCPELGPLLNELECRLPEW